MHRLKVGRLVCIVSIVAAGGCASTKSRRVDSPPQEFTGHLLSGPGESWFRPCASAPEAPAMWATFTEGSVAQLESARAKGEVVAGRRSFVRIRGVITESGQIGPAGPGKPAILVDRLLEARPAGEGDCEGGD